MKKYRLKKDSPHHAAGTLFIRWFPFEGNSHLFLLDKNRNQSYTFPADTRSEWLEEVEERWRPKLGEVFYTINMGDIIALVSWDDTKFENDWFDTYNVFRTREQAEECAKLCLETRKKYTESLNQ